MTRAARRLVAAAIAAVIGLAVPPVALGHSLEGAYQSPLPLIVYLVGAGLAVALSFAFVLLRDLRADPPPVDAPARFPPRPLRLALRGIGLVGWLWILVQGVAGGSSDADVASLFVWVYTWVGVAIVSALLFPIWHWLDPFSTLHDLGARALAGLGVKGWEPADYPAWVGRWPAIGGFAFIVWLELVLRGGFGRTLFICVVAYTAFTLAMMAQFGRDTWRANGETLTVWFRLLNRLAIFGLADERGRVRRRSFASGLLEGGWTRADVVLVALGVGSILFDGLSQTTPWFQIFGAPGPPIVTVQLAAFLALVAAAALAVSRLVGVAATGAGLLPIALGYLVAHYFTYLVVDGQRILIAISDPLQTGADIFGTAFHQPSAAFLAPGLIWTIQIIAVVGGHMIGAWGGHVVAARTAGFDRAALRSVRWRQLPLAAVMVGLTTLTLWSLGQTIVPPPESAASATVTTRR
ncbi:MAG TPA: hypothetical protein VH723_02700 [Candidatus Limnocylindrales bacterium]